MRALTALLLLAPALAAAQGEGTLDPAFAGGGHFVFGYIRPGNPFEVKEFFNTLSVDADDRIVVAGACFASQAFPLCAARHQPDGGADTTFGDYGDGLTVFGSIGQMTDSFVQADGSTVVCGSINNGVSSVAIVARLTPQGLLDTSAAGAPSGMRSVPFPSGTTIATGRCVPGPGSSVYIGATVNGSAGAGSHDFAVARLDAELQVDTTFSGDGFATAAIDLSVVNADRLEDVAVAPDGGPVMVGTDFPTFTLPDTNSRGWVACALLADGTPRVGFGSDGCRLYKHPPDQFTGTEFTANAVAFDARDRILVAGSVAKPGSAFQGAVARILLDGTQDPTFNGGTYQLLPAGNISQNTPPTAVLGMPGGRILAAGPIQPGGFFTEQISVSAILANGSGPDPTFGNGGLTLITDGINRYILGSMVLQGDRPLITGRVSYASDTENGLLVRLRGDQLLTDSFE